jgi:hypothetical protein
VYCNSHSSSTLSVNTGCRTSYRTRHFFNNSNTNEDIAKKFEQEYVHCVRNEEECVCGVCVFCCNIFIGVRIIKEMLGLVASGTSCINLFKPGILTDKYIRISFSLAVNPLFFIIEASL